MELNEIVVKVKCGGKSGTAFLINENRAITAFHNLTDYENKSIELIINNNKVKAQLSAKTTEKYKELDVALLEIESSASSVDFGIFIDYFDIVKGTKWISRGFPKAKENTGDNILQGDRNLVNQQLSELRNGKIDIDLEHSKKLSTYAGYSGSPLVIGGFIAGIINNELLEQGDSKELTALSIKHFKDLLIGEGIAVKTKMTSKFNPLREKLSQEWFKQHIDKNLMDLGVRYTPEVNVKIDVSDKFAALVCNKDFRNMVELKLNDYLNRLDKLINVLLTRANVSSLVQSKIQAIEININELELLFVEFSAIDLFNINIQYLQNKAENIKNIVYSFSKLKNDYKKSSFVSDLSNAKRACNDFNDFLLTTLHLSNEPYLLLEGKAGAGKSHLLGDLVSRQLESNTPSIFLLGQHFTNNSSPWSQIINDLLRLDCSEDELLYTLNEVGEEKEHRILFIIDAINEGRGMFFWKEYLNSFINGFKKYPWLSLVISVRDSYLSKLIPEDFFKKSLMHQIHHTGFSGRENEAMKTFFNYYGIELPNSPIYNPEFSNPLFLKLFCEGLNKRNLTQIPMGYGGISSVMNYFLNNIDKKLGQSNSYDFEESAKVSSKIVNEFIRFKNNSNKEYVSYDDACDIANEITEKYTSKRGIIDALVGEGLFSKTIFRVGNREDEGIYFAYQRLDDHFSAKLLIDEVITINNINILFRNGGDLYHLIDAASRQGLLEALSLQLPEYYKKELFELIDEGEKEKKSILKALISSLIWRDSSNINEVTDNYIKENVFKVVDTLDSFNEFFFTVAGDENHPYNSNVLHNYLISISMQKRDACWTVTLKNKESSKHAIGRLLVWVNQTDSHDNISVESRLLVATAISWLFTTTDISMRDNATKALVVILREHIKVAHALLEKFETVDDPYVYERILAAIYGAILNSLDLQGLNSLSRYIVNTLFSKQEVYPNVLVRDYARNIVEFALYKGVLIMDDPTVIRPPYISKLPETYPSNDEIDNYKFNWEDKSFNEYYWSQNKILKSMVTEYGRGTGGYGDFGRYTFESALSSWKDISPNLLSNYACKLIFEKFSYDVECHGNYDVSVAKYKKKIERIGKKYQWLALYEVIARLADNHKLTDWREENIGYYQGPWQNNIRNIDPTYLSGSNKKLELPFTLKNIEYNGWQEMESEWMVSKNNLPDPNEMIVKDDFLCLETDYSWRPEEQQDQRRLWCQIRSYFVKEAEYEQLKNWLECQDITGRWMPEKIQNYSVFSKEYYWSPAYINEFLENDEVCWQEIKKNQSNWQDKEIIAEVLPTTEGYLWEEEGVSFLTPRGEAFEEMQLNSSSVPSCWYYDNGELVCFDPYVFGEKRSELLMNKKLLEEYLKENKLKIIWTILGQKQKLGSSNHPPHWLEMSGVYYLENNGINGEMSYFTREVGWKSKQ